MGLIDFAYSAFLIILFIGMGFVMTLHVHPKKWQGRLAKTASVCYYLGVLLFCAVTVYYLSTRPIGGM